VQMWWSMGGNPEWVGVAPWGRRHDSGGPDNTMTTAQPRLTA
jgi:hypothetical protein